MKRLMLLGGSRYALPVIEAAHRLGIYVITCDYLPDNIAHKHSDQYVNVSIIEKDTVLKVAQELQIDGIMSFACDPGVVTAAYVAEKMGLPFQCSYESAVILQDKGLFRKFLTENGFNSPKSKSYSDKSAPYDDIDYFSWPVIVKPVDSAGSKGVTKVEAPDELSKAIDTALENSHNGLFIIEEFITFDGYHSSADPFIVDGKIRFITYSDHMFDADAANPYVPITVIFPTTMEKKHQDYLSGELQRLSDLLHLDTGIYNIETCVGIDGNPYIMEVSPRGGGCKISEIQELAFNVELIENEVRKAVGIPLIEIKQTDCDGFWCEFVVHAAPTQKGLFKDLKLDPGIRESFVKVVDMTAKRGFEVRPLTGANMELGNIFLKFNSREELDEVMSKSKEWLTIELM